MEASTPGTPGLVIKGTVADAVTGEPIAGVKVFDDGYANDPDWEKIESGYYEMNLPHWGDITDAKGNYAFLTYPEHHSFKIEATGYKTKRATLYSGHFTLNKKDVEIFDFKLEPVGSQKTNKFIKTLNNGVTIELVGICEHPSEGKQWWRPDGSTLSERPYNKKLEVLKNEGTAVEFFARAYSKTSEPFELDGFHIETAKEVGKAFKLENNFSPQGQTKASAAVLTEGSLYCDIEVGLWIGEWVTKAQTKGGEIISGKDRIYSFSEPVVLQDGGIKISLAHNPPDGVGISQRMILIDKQGLIHKSSKDKRSGTADLEQNEVVFHGVDMDNVQKFLFQTRPYEWVTFKNVSLKPGHKTDVQVEVENNKTTMKPEGEIFVAENYIADLPIAGKIELVSVCQFITDDREQKKLCWNPDGSKPEIPIYSRRINVIVHQKNVGFVFRSSKRFDNIFWNADELFIEKNRLLKEYSAYDENKRPLREGNYFTYQGQIDDRDSTNIKLRIQPYDWSTKAEYDGKYTIGKVDDRIRFIESYDSGPGATVIFESNFGDELQTKVEAEYVEYNQDNRPSTRSRTASVRTATDAEGQRVSAAVFRDIKLENIRVFRFMARPKAYEWVEFKNVSLKPGYKTNVQVEGEDVAVHSPGNDEYEEVIRSVDTLIQEWYLACINNEPLRAGACWYDEKAFGK
ncbi:MAG: peptidase associated/transthyretin-like domain-containing protein, partial [Planctomycetota bacterium]